MKTKIKKIKKSDREEALDFVYKIFMEFEAPDYSQEGIDTFTNFINNKELSRNLVMYGAYCEDKLVGLIATRNDGNHITLLFVDGNYHRQGIGRQLFELMVEKSTGNKISVNSSPFAVEFYHRLGFVDTDCEHIDDGIRYTPMIYVKSNTFS